jgi:hypothetical protein
MSMRCDPMTAPDVLVEHYGPMRPGMTCDWWVAFTDRARPEVQIHVWDDWPECSCVQANQLVRALRESESLMAALRTGDLEWAYELADAIAADAEEGWVA